MSMFVRTALPAALAAVLLGACSSTPSRFQTSSRAGLTGGTETMRATPPSSVYSSPPAAARRSDDPHANAVYRGGRDPVTGRAPQPQSWNAPSSASQPRAEAVSTAQRPRVAGRTVVEVVEGDTLYGLSTKYRVSMNSIMAANGLKDPTLTPGQKLTIPAR